MERACEKRKIAIASARMATGIWTDRVEGFERGSLLLAGEN
jgi:hypothetical protein